MRASANSVRQRKMRVVSSSDELAASQSTSTVDVLIVGGGPGGLAVSQQLGERGIANVVVESGQYPGWMWGQTYESLRLHTGKHLSALPGMPFPRGTDLFPSRAEFTSYMESYSVRFAIPLRFRVEAHAVEREEGTWRVRTNRGWVLARTLVVATGIMSSPTSPKLPGLASFEGHLTHSSKYRQPSSYAGQRVLVVGIGNSGAEIAVELAEAGARVAVSVRSGANNVPLSIAGVPSQYLGWAISWMPRRLQQRLTRLFGLAGSLIRGGSPIPRKEGFGECPDVPLIGNKLAKAVESGEIELLPDVDRFVPDGALFTNGSRYSFDGVILATGYRAAIEWLGDFGERDKCGFAKRRDRVQSLEHSGLYFIGHNYDGRGGLYNISIDAKRIARLIHADQGL